METKELGNGIFKVTALSYFKEALLNQEFEGCKELIAIARKLGVQKAEIDRVIASYLRGDKAQGPNEALGKNRLHILKEE